MKIILVTILPGIVASTVRALFLELISKFRIVHLYMIKAIGSGSIGLRD